MVPYNSYNVKNNLQNVDMISAIEEMRMQFLFTKEINKFIENVKEQYNITLPFDSISGYIDGKKGSDITQELCIEFSKENMDQLINYGKTYGNFTKFSKPITLKLIKSAYDLDIYIDDSKVDATNEEIRIFFLTTFLYRVLDLFSIIREIYMNYLVNIERKLSVS